MKLHREPGDTGFGRWQRRVIDRVRSTLRYLQQVLAVDRPTHALALIPVRDVLPHAMPEQRRRHWRD
ncbi:MAG: hypothetical protein HY855_16690 [Burkholderiales bacterium]|nr:hypothetical protein [Burkholderiales bacterium]